MAYGVQQVTRDAQLREFLVAEQIEVAREFGSGYPGGAAAPLSLCSPCTCCSFVAASHSFVSAADPVTQAWLTAHKEPIFGYPGLVRFSWQGTVRILAEHGADVQWCALSNASIQEHRAQWCKYRE